jgi:hypothetical protein
MCGLNHKGNTMFYVPPHIPDFSISFFIDTMQSAKRNVINNIISDTTLNKIAQDFISVESTYIKTICDSSLSLTKYFIDCQTKQLFPKQK